MAIALDAALCAYHRILSGSSFNGKLRDELLNGEIFETLLEAKVLIEGWRQEYNQVRPHSALGYRPPTLHFFLLEL